MQLILVTAPTADVLSLADAKAHLRVDHDDDNDLITACIAAAVGELDAAAGAAFGRALRPQMWELRLHQFPCEPLKLPCPPLISVASWKYDDVNGVEQTLLEETAFRVIGAGSMGRAALAPVYGTWWPAARCDYESVRVRFTAGYRLAQSDPPVPADELPRPILQWLKLRVGKYYEFREDTLAGNNPPAALPVVDSLIAPYRVF